MKLSKKLIISSLSTTAALSFVAALSGTLAWYQYNTRVSTTIIGTNVAETGSLQISLDESNWTKDLVTSDLIGGADHIDLKPVTFGAMLENNTRPNKGYMKPDASANGEWDAVHNTLANVPGSYEDIYQEAKPNVDYIEYTVYLRAMEVENQSGLVQKEKDVYLSNIIFMDTNGNISSGLRAHIAIDADRDDVFETNYLVSKNEVKILNSVALLMSMVLTVLIKSKDQRGMLDAMKW